ncbi:hypothetical protein [Spirilliplanes yamanashiensis]|uniref:Uncharacterized protein n=1 Tax=Spirilliplanes yamanashiensis TaxID=42233 RepID=A0A8J3YAS3_9ACTN|nr:hypothetical protein [Spirilliplanes yamanashiensis]MDP9818782.1 hypothetical protein [Spirilliplanes yamanashiensis]GIJ05236.1 hypothetical protein Sya03_45880 [Spirilliplanes yamanashiensis]
MRRSRAQQNWLLSVLPAFPLILLALRLWYLSRQDLPTMLLLVQYVSPFGLISALVITLIWTVPAVVLPLRALGGLLLVSARDPLDAGRSLLAVTALRMPDWVVVLAALLAALTWQLRFLPALVMLLVAIIGLTAWQRHRDERLVLVVLTVAVPAAAALLVYAWVGPGVVAALREREWSTAVLLAVPPALALLLTGPVPARSARLATHWPAVGAALLAPFAIGAVFLRAPILPSAAVELDRPGGPPAVLNGHIVTVDDTTTTLLDRAGRVRFLPNGEVRSKTLCPERAQAPAAAVRVRGWHVEQSALEWIAPARRPEPADPRCLGRPLTP